MQRNNRIRRLLFRLLLLSALSWLINMIRRDQDEDSWEFPESSPHWEPQDPEPAEAEVFEADESEPRKAAFSAHRPFAARRVASSMAFAILFFAGAAFTAGAGDRVVRFVDEQQECTPAVEEMAAVAEAEVCAEEEAEVAADPSEETAAAPESAAPAAEVEAGAEAEAEATGGAVADEEPQVEVSEPASETGASAEGGSTSSEPGTQSSPEAQREQLSPKERPIPARGTHRWVVKRARSAPAHAPEIEGPAEAATIWLNRALPDPTPPARRLARRFARNLASVSREQHVDWALLLAVLRVQGDRSAVPATKGELRILAKRLRAEHAGRDAWAAVLAVSGRTGFADRTMALTHYNHAVGMEALVTGLRAAKPRLVKKLLADPRATIYPGGRDDLRRNRIDVRVVVLIRYLAETFDQVTVSSLFSGHRMYSRPGVVSAHIYGHAVDISALGGSSIFGNQQPGGLTEEAVRAILLLPSEVQPRQVISLLGLGGASFPLSDHADHIHVGY